ncbi:phosphoglucosamine mutase [Candidatus Dependentiae bacterium]|nr:phosphoglucosamine mutase [Candidatus Dependentiae bacterium]
MKLRKYIVKQEIKFGTDGIRGNAKQFPFTKKALNYLGMAIGKWSIKKYKKKKPTVLIGYDTRSSSPRIAKNIIGGLNLFGINVFNAKILPTPAVCLLTKKTKKIDFGIVISASHNPYTDNGIKIIDSKKIKLTKKDEEKIIVNFKNISQTKYNNLNYLSKPWKEAYKTYQQQIISLFKPNFLKNLKIVLDCSNGANYKIAPKIFKKLGATVFTIFNKPTGKNINEDCGTLYLKNLKNTIFKKKADIGFAFDGDGDRVLAISKSGKIIDGDDILELLSKHPELINYNKIVGTIMSNFGLEQHLHKKNKTLIRTPVGDKYIAIKLEEENLHLGGENSGHIIIKNYINTGDGIYTALKVLESILSNDNWEIKTFKKIPQILLNIPVAKKKDLTIEPYANIIEEYKNLLINGRFVIRYSGTENLLRIMVEDEQLDHAKKIAMVLAHKLQNTLIQE